MFKRVSGFFLSHIAANVYIYCICVFFLVIGIIVGVVSGSGFENNAYFTEFFANLKSYSAGGYVKDGFVHSLVLTLLIFLAGISPLGFAAIPLAVSYKGFVTGYTVSAFFSVYGAKTFLFIILGIIPSALFWIPAYMYGAVTGMLSSCCFFRILRRKSVNNISDRVSGLLISSVILFVGVVFSKFTEIFLIPEMLNIVGVLYT